MQTNTCFTCGYENKGSGSICHQCGTPINLSGGSSESSGVHVSGAAQEGLKFRRGQIIAKRYVVKDMVGRGGMGCIYRVHDNTLNEELALKTLLPQYTQDKLVVDRFFNEARIARGLSHPNIVRVHDIGVTEHIAYISMELIAGKTLRDVLDASPMRRPLKVDTILTIFEDLCSALEYAHKFTIHRDIKPENVMILKDGSVKLMDFGISKLMTNPSLTSASMVMGTPHYMSPEQLRNSAGVDARSDVYSAGVMLCEMLTGQTPTGVPKPASEADEEVPVTMDPIVEKCVEPNPAKRFQTASELREAIVAARTSERTRRELVSRAPTGRTRSRSLRVLSAGALMATAVAGAVVGLQHAEQRQADLIAAHALATGSTSPPREAAADSAKTFSQMKSLEDMVREYALEALREEGGTRYNPWNTRMLSEAEGYWESAVSEAVNDPNVAVGLGWESLVRYVAVVVRPERMVFVPPTQVTYYINEIVQTRYVDAFFIDEREVSWREFADFGTTGTGWRWPNNAPRWEFPAPMTHLSFYDAQAFVASQPLSRKLPMYAQLMAALDPDRSYPVAWWGAQGDESFIMDDDFESGEVSLKTSLQEHEVFYKWADCGEWSRSVWGPSAAGTYFPEDYARQVGFGTQFVIEQGSYGEGQHSAYSPMWLAYRGWSDRVGFRSVYELPKTVDGLRTLVRSIP